MRPQDERVSRSSKVAVRRSSGSGGGSSSSCSINLAKEAKRAAGLVRALQHQRQQEKAERTTVLPRASTLYPKRRRVHGKHPTSKLPRAHEFHITTSSLLLLLLLRVRSDCMHHASELQHAFQAQAVNPVSPTSCNTLTLRWRPLTSGPRLALPRYLRFINSAAKTGGGREEARERRLDGRRGGGAGGGEEERGERGGTGCWREAGTK